LNLLPIQWKDFKYDRFSENKTLFDFQQEPLENALPALWLFYKDKNADKQELYKHYQLNGLDPALTLTTMASHPRVHITGLLCIQKSTIFVRTAINTVVAYCF